MGIIAIQIGPFFVIYGIFALPIVYRGVAIFVVIFGWGIAAGYKDWIINKRQEEKMRIRS